ncbi:MAG: 3-hydroxyacyl-CoA dehydrogenase, partial [Pseudooceanicola nanhaiensis]
SDVTGQIFGVRNNEIFLFSQPRPIRSAHRSEGWTPETVRDHALPAMKSDFYPLERSGDIFTWDPV